MPTKAERAAAKAVKDQEKAAKAQVKAEAAAAKAQAKADAKAAKEGKKAGKDGVAAAPAAPEAPKSKGQLAKEAREAEAQRLSGVQCEGYASGVRVLKILEAGHTPVQFHCQFSNGTSGHVDKELFEGVL